MCAHNTMDNQTGHKTPANNAADGSLQLTEAIILAGGLGTRLRSAVPDLPKCMAPVHGRPFIAYVIDHLLQQGITSFILSLGYKADTIVDFIQQQYPTLRVQFSIETEPLGTGGAIQLACTKATTRNVIATNGDTLFTVDVAQLAAYHSKHNAACTLCLKPMQHFNRYGVVEVLADGRISSFKEKQAYVHGLINGGVYAINVETFLHEGLPERFSFEKDYLEKRYTQRTMVGLVQDAYFIDIGIPEDYERAQRELTI